MTTILKEPVAKPSAGARIVCGIRSTGNVHLGNYLGAILPAVKLQEELAG